MAFLDGYDLPNTPAMQAVRGYLEAEHAQDLSNADQFFAEDVEVFAHRTKPDSDERDAKTGRIRRRYTARRMFLDEFVNRGAAGALRDGEKGEALSRQGEAMEGLRESARSMAQQMLQQGRGNEGNFGRNGEARGNRDDPLGRPMPRTGEDLGPERNMLPGQAAVERARQILELLRNRANQPQRPRLELDYLDRLLDGLY